MVDTLIVSEAKYHEALKSFFAVGPNCQCCTSAGQARRQLSSGSYQLVIINAPLQDESGRELAKQAASQQSSVILLAAAAQAEKLADQLERLGIFVIPKPLNRQTAVFVLRFVRAAQARAQKLLEENHRLVRRLEEMRLVTRAKCALVRYCDMTEEQAHRALEQRAMDERISLKEAALSLLSQYESV